MSRPISFFCDYHGRENTVTNYCGLMLKMVYEESPLLFQELIATLLGGDLDLKIGPNFMQQKRMVGANKNKNQASIPDLAIIQQSFAVFFENKLSNWFYEDQIKKHIDGFGAAEKKILFLMTNWEDDGGKTIGKDINDGIKKAKDEGVIVKAISFEDLVGSMENMVKSENLSNMLEQFTLYLDKSNLLPRWKYMLDVVNCGQTLDEIAEGAYICPDTGGAYSHRRAKYFGPYANKKVESIFKIDAVVTFEPNFITLKKEPEIKWNNSKLKNEDLVERSKKVLTGKPDRLNEIKNTPLQVFLLSEGTETNFIKDSSGGMQTSKIYFEDIAKKVNADSVSELAAKLKDKKWEDFRK